jgi:WhiB family transcriptional regulator, redox-sensing transcriptional regulator
VSSGNRSVDFAGLGQWMHHAACRNTVTSPDDDVFFPPDAGELPEHHRAVRQLATEREQQALAICNRCPVQDNCLAYAVATRQRHGVWGGRSQQELRRLIAAAGPYERRMSIGVGVGHGPRPGLRCRCPAGHPYDEANSYRYGDRRVCRSCQLARTRARPQRPTHCPRGHAYDQTNTAYDARGHRRCLACLFSPNAARSHSPLNLEGGGSDAA